MKATSMKPNLDTIRHLKLQSLASQRFGHALLPAEDEVLRVSSSSEVNFQPENPGLRPEVRAELLRWLATDLDCRDHIDPRGLRVCCATITGELNLGNCRMPFPLAFHACTFQKVLSLVAARAQQLVLVACSTSQGIKADGLIVEGGLFLRYLDSLSEIRLPGAEIGGNVECQGTRIVAEGVSLNLEGAEVHGNIFLKPYQLVQPPRPFLSTGSVRLTGAIVHGDLDCTDAGFCIQGTDSSAYAINLDRANITGSIRLGAKFKATREISAVGARIGESLECCGAHLAESGKALTLNRTEIGGSVFLGVNFWAAGDINLGYAEIANDLNCDGARIGAVHCEDTKVSGSMVWTNITDATNIGKSLNVSGASVKIFIDDEASWPTKGELVLDGLNYRDIELHKSRATTQVNPTSLPPKIEFDLKKRIAWLKLQSSKDQLEPQPWMQLANLLKEKGQESDARRAIFAFRCAQAEASSNLVRCFRRFTADLEREPLAVWKLALPLLIIGTALFWFAGSKGAIAPTNKDAYDAWASGGQDRSAQPLFNPLVYTVENELPLVRLGQDDKWAPDPQYDPSFKLGRFPYLIQRTTYFSLVALRLILIFAGWFQATAIVAAMGRRFRS
jgi:hypothetical protein